MDFATTILTAPAIIAAVNFLKKQFGLSGDWASLAAVLIGILFGVVTHGMEAGWTPDKEMAAQAIVGFILGLGASGIYDVAKPKPPLPPETPVEVELVPPAPQHANLES